MNFNVSPREFLRARRPERFSDSVTEPVSELDRSILEYHLQSLTSRSQETEFEQFARALIRCDVCPNLLPQTGPTGGGDSKVDSETYPVAEDLAFVWHVGEPSKASSERWAFAFSAKKDWRGKCKSDIKKLVGTEREYKNAYFVTNQYVRDKVRAELEDELRNEHKIDVRIFDLTWILDTVFDNSHQDIAIEKLSVSSSLRKDKRLGPNDLRREQSLEAIEARIEKHASEDSLDFVVVDDCIDAAILSVELEKPEIETFGRFDRAERMAKKHGTLHQSVRAAYQRAWALYFWFEDIEQFSEAYSKVFELAADSSNIYDLELLSYLWMLISGHGKELPNADGEAEKLHAVLKPFLELEDRPCTVLEARAIELRIQLLTQAKNADELDRVLAQFASLIEECAQFIGFPLQPLLKTLGEIGRLISDSKVYDSLHDRLTEIVTTRKGSVEGAKLLLQRAEQQLDGGNPNDALRTLGKVLPAVAKNESRVLFCHSLYNCACAYERLGLLWAARGTLLLATSVSTAELWKYEETTPFQIACFRRLKWLELQLARLPEVLSWHQVDMSVRSMMLKKGYDEHALREGDVEFDFALGIVLLNADLRELKQMQHLPDLFNKMALRFSQNALLYALGHDCTSEFNELVNVPSGETEQVFLNWRDHPARSELGASLVLCNQQSISFRSEILGCQFEVHSETFAPCIEFAESILSSIEAALATGLARGVLAREQQFTIRIRKSDFAESLVDSKLEDNDGLPCLSVVCDSNGFNDVGLEAATTIQDELVSIVANVVARMSLSNGDVLHSVLLDDSGFSRSVNFTSSLRTIVEVMGGSRKRSIDDWLVDSEKSHELRRSQLWDAALPKTEKAGRNERTKRQFPPDIKKLKHSDVKMVSIIRMTLWDKAKWQAVGFLSQPDRPPILTIAFWKKQPAKQIFTLWKNEFGDVDTAEAIRVTIIRGVSKKRPAHYRVVISSNLDKDAFKAGKQILGVVSRIQNMEPDTTKNLDQFLDAYEHFSAFVLAPSIVKDQTTYPEPIDGCYILKRKLIVKQAWEVGVHDLERTAIFPDDDPIIPEGVNEPPVNEVLALHEPKVEKAKAKGSSPKKVKGKNKRKQKRKEGRKSRKRNR